MACCLIVIYLVGRAMDTLARWAIFWGLRPAPAGSRLPTWRTRWLPGNALQGAASGGRPPL